VEIDAGVAANYDELPLWSAVFGQLLLEQVPLRIASPWTSLGFLDGWQGVAGDEVLAAVEDELNRRGEVTLTIPAACFEGVKP
jgi:hypothetical protein